MTNVFGQKSVEIYPEHSTDYLYGASVLHLGLTICFQVVPRLTAQTVIDVASQEYVTRTIVLMIKPILSLYCFPA